MRARRVFTLVIIALVPLATSGIPTAPGKDSASAKPAVGEEHHETIEDPYIPVARENRLTAPSALVVRGQHHSVQINVDGTGGNILGDAANEPSLAIDPTDPDNLVVGWRQFDTIASNFRQAGYAYSHDGGASWTFPGVLQQGQFRSDPVLSADSSGSFYYYSLSSATMGDLFVSTDKGESWSGPFPAFGGDKEWMTVDDTGGIGNGNLYVAWNYQFTCCAAGTDFTRSLDGVTFEAPTALPSKAKWGTVAVGPDGELYSLGARTDTLTYPVPHLVMKSTNAKDPAQVPSFGAAVGVVMGGDTIFGVGPNPGGMLGQVWVAVDRSNGPTRGNVYALASVDPQGGDPLDVMFVRSTDGGNTWSAPVRVNDDPTSSHTYQWFATMSVAPAGRIDVVWNDARNDVTGVTSELRYAYSTDAGATWSASLPVSPSWNASLGYPNQNKIGDYYHMISDAEGASVVYAATFNGEQDVYFLRVGDCNADGLHDSTDISLHTSLDCNANRIPDECEEIAPACAICSTDATCSDGLFCDGLETCNLATSRCQAPESPPCNDNDSCTADSCDEPGDTCLNAPFLPPGPLQETLQATHDGMTGITTLVWSSMVGAEHYNTYRGSIPAGGMGSAPSGPYDHACLEGADTAGDGATLSSDAGVPPPGTARYFLINGENGCGEGSLGSSSAGVPRPNLLPCPSPP
jgi:hypothetical protein